MAFTSGISGNPNGRPKGSKNKATGQLREMIADFLEQQFEQVIYDFNRLEPKDRIKAYSDLLQYGLPKLQAVSTSIDYSSLSDGQLNEIINKITSGNAEQ